MIHVLDKHTAELIAAGEVVERPASVVKELVENAIDAGAGRIQVAIERGGISLISVQDDGTGIEAEYIATAFIRHATSKIARESDLDAIGTLGFRGEALASISAVSRVELLTRTEQDEFACLYRQEGGEELSAEAAARPIGTTITVRDLFYNVPARMKFLKKDQSEANYVGDVVLRQALAHPEISFTYIKDGKEQFQTPGDGKLMSAIYGVLARDFAKNLMEVQLQSGTIKAEGFVTAPIACRGSRSMQFFYVNGRYVENTTMMAALETAYKGMAMQGRFPGCVLNLTMPLDRVDVNVHPAKTEVRFANNGEIFDLVYKAVKGTIAAQNAPQREISLEQGEKMETRVNPFLAGAAAAQKEPVQPVSFTAPIADAAPRITKETQSVSTPAAAAQTVVTVLSRAVEDAPVLAQDSFAPYTTSRDTPSAAPRQWELDIEKAPEEAFVPPVVSVQQSFAEPEQTEPDAPQSTPLRYLGEAFATYLIAECEESLVLIDKHAAHERILYEKLLAGYGAVDGQMLLEPVAVNLDAAEKNALAENEEMLIKAGFEVEDFGGNSVLVRAVPVDASTTNLVALTEEIAHKLSINAKNTLSEKTDWVLHSIACRAAIKAGDKDRPEALMVLAQEILDGKVPPFCPHGRPVVLRLTRKELEKQFGRIQ